MAARRRWNNGNDGCTLRGCSSWSRSRERVETAFTIDRAVAAGGKCNELNRGASQRERMALILPIRVSELLGGCERQVHVEVADRGAGEGEGLRRGGQLGQSCAVHKGAVAVAVAAA